MEKLTLKWDFSKEEKRKLILSLKEGEKENLFSIESKKLVYKPSLETKIAGDIKDTTELQKAIFQNLLNIKGRKCPIVKNILFKEKSIWITLSGTWTNYHCFQIEFEIKKEIPEIEFV